MLILVALIVSGQSAFNSELVYGPTHLLFEGKIDLTEEQKFSKLLIEIDIEMAKAYIAQLPPEQRMAGLSPEQRAAGLDTDGLKRLLKRIKHQLNWNYQMATWIRNQNDMT